MYVTEFFVKLNDNKYGLLTNNHIINNIGIGNTINFYYLSKYKKIEITKDREVYTNEKLDYTFIEIFKEDNIEDYFKIYSNNIINLKHHNIFILQYPNNINNEISFSYGKIKLIGNNEIRYNASTTYGSSGSPIILRSNNNLIIGIHHSGYISKGDNIGTLFNSILIDIQQKNNNVIINKSINANQKFNNLLNNINKNERNKILYEYKNEINCIYNKKGKEPIHLLHDFRDYIIVLNDEGKKLYEEAKKNISENYIEIYINNKKIKFNCKYESNVIGQIKVKFKFNKLLNSTSYMFSECSSLKSIDLSSFNANNITKMSYMFYKCSSLETIYLSSFNTNNAINMSGMFYRCSSLKSIDLSSFNTNNVIDMSHMFYKCSSLKSIDLSSFNTNNVIDMSRMFYKCSSLETIDLSSFNTNNATNMGHMFLGCSSLKSIDLSSFNTNNATNIGDMFKGCSSLKKENVKINKNEKKILEILPSDCQIF